MKQIALKYPSQRADVLLERDMLTYLDHPLVVPMYCSFETVGQMYMTMEYVKGGDLEDLLEKEKHFRMDMAHFYMAELVLAVEYIHSYGILHMDLKPSNLLITKEGHIKVADFGLSKIGSVSTAALMTEADCRRNAREFTDTETCGTPVFMAPELYLKTGYGKPVDWWAAGVILYNLLYGVVPFDGNNKKEVAKLVTEDDIHFPDGGHPSLEFARQLISGLLEKDPVRRLGTRGASEVKRHPFFQGVDWKKLPYETPPYVPDVKKMLDGSSFSCTPSKLRLTSSDSDDDDYDEPPTGQTNFCTVAFRFNKVYGSPMPLSPCTPMNRRLLSAKPGDSEAKEEQQEIEASDEGFSDEEDSDDMGFSEACLGQSGHGESQSDNSSPSPHHSAPGQMDSVYFDSDSDGEDNSKFNFRLPCLRQSGRDESQSDSAPTPPPHHAAPVQMDSEYIDRDSEWEDISQHSSEASLRQSGQDESQCDSAPSPAPHHASPVQMDPVEECLSEDLLDATWSLLDIQFQMAELARDLSNTLQNDLVRPDYFMELQSQLVDILQETHKATCKPTVEDVSSEEDREPNNQGRWPPTQSPVLLKVSTR
ncbi:microtubule-associated serine/threonine-protein kinase 3-like [Sebastes umbrosus]|uniref:microtubule-associated serine/threonine-protein kinase 3-like n=1 Tax=Sebastes umbrosus TaxID=72105 RepID=UPI0018A0818A|nr:microtubule-associated serine/threonine-protein kinase 3-like [Sebastes umbrosus]